MLTILLPVIFIIGILFVAIEEKTKINKAAIAIVMSIILWGLVLMNIDLIVGVIPKNILYAYAENNSLLGHDIIFQTRAFVKDILLIEKLGEVATTIFFIMSTMVIIELVDANGGFRIITNSVTTRNKRLLLWAIAFFSFFISAILDNIAAAIVVVALLRKLIDDDKDRMIFACIAIISANAGGSWSPIGDVTTILLWSNGNITALHQITTLILPALVTLCLPMLIAQRFFKKNDKFPPSTVKLEDISRKRKAYGVVILIIAVLSLVMVPVFTEITSLPPFMGALCGLSVLWIFTDVIFGKVTVAEMRKMSVVKVFSKIDMPTILFFFGILMSVAAIDAAGILVVAGDFVSKTISHPLLISFIIGICSSLVDNVALVAATMGMYPLSDPSSVGVAANYIADSSFWTFLAYCSVTGGSILIIGSATGVTVMGMEKISFIYYLKKFSLLAFIGYIGGALCYLLMINIF